MAPWRHAHALNIYASSELQMVLAHTLGAVEKDGVSWTRFLQLQPPQCQVWQARCLAATDADGLVPARWALANSRWVQATNSNLKTRASWYRCGWVVAADPNGSTLAALRALERDLASRRLESGSPKLLAGLGSSATTCCAIYVVYDILTILYTHYCSRRSCHCLHNSEKMVWGWARRCGVLP